MAHSLKNGLGLASVALFIAVWELGARSGAVTEFMLPRLSAVLLRMVDDFASGELLGALGLTLYRVLTGFAIASIAGILIGLAMSRNRTIHWLLDPMISVAFPMPKIAFLPIVTLALGFGDVAKLFMVVVDTIIPIITATIAGAQAAEKELRWSARSLGASDREVWREIVLPAALPQVLTGMQVALPIAMVIVVVTEMVMGGGGVGGAMIAASRFSDSPGVFAGIVEIGLLGYCIVKGMSLLRRHVLRWHQEASDVTTV
ncbi:MAG: ABC transporter permease [Burkholderiales bacterium]